MALLAHKRAKIFGADFPGQSKLSRTQPKSIASYVLSYVVVVPDSPVLRLPKLENRLEDWPRCNC